jgi:hypothetical protein
VEVGGGRGPTRARPRANEILATREAFYQNKKNWVVWGLCAEIEIWTFFGSFRAGSNLGHAGIFFARVCPLGRADDQ